MGHLLIYYGRLSKTKRAWSFRRRFLARPRQR
jgi:hypothetical protein